MDIVVWLRSLGLGKYEAAFRENDIDETVLPNLTVEDLKELALRRWATAVSFSTASLLCAPMERPSLLPLRSDRAHAANGCDGNCRARRRSYWRAPTCHGDVLRSCRFDQHLCGA